jgi:hypothetical protein
VTTADVEVVDTTPDVACPADTTAECSASAALPAGSPWLASAVATTSRRQPDHLYRRLLPDGVATSATFTAEEARGQHASMLR